MKYADTTRENDDDHSEARAFVYMLRCADGTLYTGWTNDVEKRLAAHNAGRGARYTAARRPVELVYIESADTRSAALSREYAIKRLTRHKKLELKRSDRNELGLRRDDRRRDRPRRAQRQGRPCQKRQGDKEDRGKDRLTPA